MEHDQLLIALGLMFLAGLAADQIGRLTRLPRVTMLLLLGVLVGHSGFDLLPTETAEWFPLLSVIALTMVAFLLGGSLTAANLKSNGKAIFSLSVIVVLGTMIIVCGGLLLLGLDGRLALLLGAIATATAPAAIADVIRQSGVKNGFTDTVSGIVAIDDVWGLVAFSVCLAIVHQGGGWAGPIWGAAWDIGGAIGLGVLVALPAAYLTGRLKPGAPMQSEAIGVVLLLAGFSIWLEVSFLVAGMTAGALIANLARHHEYAFNEIEHVDWPFMMLFFLLAGASLELDAVWALGGITAAYVGLRIVARILAGEIGSRIANVPATQRHAFGPALMPQAGVAVGMALVAAETLPEWGQVVMSITIAATVVFEIIGPPCTLAAINYVVRRETNDKKTGALNSD
jgi:Kef-type K+ transport system membrane component KefB